MKFYTKIFLFVLLFLLYFTISAFNYSEAITKDISNSIFRLHVIANSDTIEDQNLKYKVRNSILEYMNSLISTPSSKDNIKRTISLHLNEFQTIAQKTVYENGYNYSVSVQIGNFNFPAKTYGDITFPAGFYDALRVEIGDANGQNWWCVMFPPLCFIDITSGIVPDESKEILESELTEDEYNLLCSNTKDFSVKFKIVEVLQNFKNSDIFM